MLVWGLSLLVLASGARSLLIRSREARPSARQAPDRPIAPKRDQVASREAWRRALVAKLLHDRARATLAE